MIKEKKIQAIEELKGIINSNNFIYLTDLSGLNAQETSQLRRYCFDAEISLRVVKNTILKKAIEKSTKDFSPFFEILSGDTSLMTAKADHATSVLSKAPACVIKKFRESSKGKKPILKGAYVEESFYMGDDQLENLIHIKTKEELLGDLVALLSSPIKNVLSSLQSGGQKISGLLKTLSEKS